MKIYDFSIKLRELIEMLEQEKELTPILKEIKELNLLSEDGIIVCEYEKETITADFNCIKEKKYGSTNIKIYKHN